MNAKLRVNAEHVAQQFGAVKDVIYRRHERRGSPAHKFGWFWNFQHSESDEWGRPGRTEEEKELE
jgi:hypothetical protein